MHLAIKGRTPLTVLLTRTAQNSAFYAALTGAEVISEISEAAGYRPQPGYRLIRVDRRLDKESVSEFEIALVDDAQASVAYYVEATLMSIPEVSSRSIAQHEVWRSANTRHSLALREISRTVLFNYIVQRYDLLLAEQAATGEGTFYWHRQVSRAIELGLHVYAYDPAKQALQPIPTQCELNDVRDQAWSGAAQKSVWTLISTSPLQSN